MANEKPIVTFTPDETAARERIKALQAEIAALRQIATRDVLVELHKLGDGTIGPVVICPYCGGKELQYAEDLIDWRELEGIDDGGTLIVDGEDILSENGDNQRLSCLTCDEDCNFGTLEMDWS